MGEVYKARDTRLDRTIAIKILPEALAGDPQFRERFDREARAISQLTHPHICTLHDIGEVDGQRFIVMELLEGRTLAEAIAGKPLALDQLLGVAVDILDALEAAHAHGIVHRDIKPSNIFLASRGDAKILDFGLAKLGTRARVAASTADTAFDPSLTAEGATVGTVAYMSPEQVRGDAVDARCDLFSFAVVLYEMATGQRPFTGATAAVITEAILNRNPVPPSRINRSVPAALDVVVGKAIEKDPQRRYQSATGMRAELERIRRDVIALDSGAAVAVRGAKPAAIAATLALLAAAAAGGLYWQRASRQREALELVPEITRLADAGEFGKAAALARTARAWMPRDPAIARLWERATVAYTIYTDPPGADVNARSYSSDSNTWERLGRTPLVNGRVPRATWIWRVTKDGFAPVTFLTNDDYAVEPGAHVSFSRRIRLRRADDVPAGMVTVPAGGDVTVRSMPLGALQTTQIDDFLIDQHEVTNEEYKRFVDAGGYEKRDYWRQPFMRNGEEIGLDEAVTQFRDSTGRPGPATWEAGTYPNGLARHPVAGINWYEAAAYAEFTGRSLPTAFHWTLASQNTIAVTAAAGNFRDSGTQEVGKPAALSGYGTTDMAGNVKEWCVNEGDDGQRFILGGGFGEPTYMFGGLDERMPWDRQRNFGFRTIKLDTPASAQALAPIATRARNFSFGAPVPDNVFAAFRGLFAYDRTDLNALVEETESSQAWTREKISFDAAYSHERVIAQVFLPKHATPPFQVVMYFPGGFARQDEKLDLRELEGSYDFVMKSGRALVMPIYKGTYERRDGLQEGQPPASYRDHVIMIAKDLRRTIDYLESRPDIDATRVGYAGLSWGAQLATVLLTVEPRIKAAILDSGGFPLRHDLPEVDRINFAPRVQTPVLMINGRFDASFPLESSQDPMFRMLGTRDADKKHILYDVGHSEVPQKEKIRESLDWFDKYLGPVRR